MFHNPKFDDFENFEFDYYSFCVNTINSREIYNSKINEQDNLFDFDIIFSKVILYLIIKKENSDIYNAIARSKDYSKWTKSNKYENVSNFIDKINNQFNDLENFKDDFNKQFILVINLLLLRESYNESHLFKPKHDLTRLKDYERLKESVILPQRYLIALDYLKSETYDLIKIDSNIKDSIIFSLITIYKNYKKIKSPNEINKYFDIVKLFSSDLYEMLTIQILYKHSQDFTSYRNNYQKKLLIKIKGFNLSFDIKNCIYFFCYYKINSIYLKFDGALNIENKLKLISELPDSSMSKISKPYINNLLAKVYIIRKEFNPLNFKAMKNNILGLNDIKFDYKMSYKKYFDIINRKYSESKSFTILNELVKTNSAFIFDYCQYYKIKYRLEIISLKDKNVLNIKNYFKATINKYSYSTCQYPTIEEYNESLNVEFKYTFDLDYEKSFYVYFSPHLNKISNNQLLTKLIEDPSFLVHPKYLFDKNNKIDNIKYLEALKSLLLKIEIIHETNRKVEEEVKKIERDNSLAKYDWSNDTWEALGGRSLDDR